MTNQQVHLAVQNFPGDNTIIFVRGNLIEQLNYIFTGESADGAHLTPSALQKYAIPTIIDPNQIVKLPLLLTCMEKWNLFSKIEEPLLIFDHHPKHLLVTLGKSMSEIILKIRLSMSYLPLKWELKKYANLKSDKMPLLSAM